MTATIDLEPSVLARAPKVHHSYYVVAELRAKRDWNTHEVEVSGTLGIAPDSTTVIEYPIHVWLSGYWGNKAVIRKAKAIVKARLLAEIKQVGYTLGELTEPLSVVDRT